MSPLDQAVQAHMAHPAMACDDPLTECLLAQLAPPAATAQPGTAHGSDASMLLALQRVALRAHAVARREYTRGWAWGVVCGLTAGVCTTGGAVWLWHVATAAWACPTC